MNVLRASLTITTFFVLVGCIDGAGRDPADDVPFDQLVGQVENGEAIFSANNCAFCHCSDASGGCAFNAPANRGASASLLDFMLRGAGQHPGGKFDFSNQDLVDLEAYLASL